MKTESYTSQIMGSMINGMIETKLSRGFRRASNGLLEDCVGQLYTVDVEQTSEIVGKGEEAFELHRVVVKCKPVSLVSF